MELRGPCLVESGAPRPLTFEDCHSPIPWAVWICGFRCQRTHRPLCCHSSLSQPPEARLGCALESSAWVIQALRGSGPSRLSGLSATQSPGPQASSEPRQVLWVEAVAPPAQEWAHGTGWGELEPVEGGAYFFPSSTQVWQTVP